MEKKGKVKKVNGKKATVLLQRSSACGECSECMIPGSDKIEIEADNPVCAKEEDKVQVKVEEVNLFLLSIFVYLIPLLLFLLGLFIGYQIFPFLFNSLKYRSLFSVFSGILFLLIVSVPILRNYNKKEKCNFEIVKIINS